MNETFTSKIDVNSQIIGKVLVQCTLHSILSESLDESTPNVALTFFSSVFTCHENVNFKEQYRIIAEQRGPLFSP